MNYKKVSIKEELPPMNEFVTCFYDSGETMVYKRFETGITTLVDSDVIDTTIGSAVQKDWAWTIRDGIADRTPKEGKITHWLKEVEIIKEDLDAYTVTRNQLIATENIVVEDFIIERDLIKKRILELNIYLDKPTTKERCSYIIYNFLLMKLYSMETYASLLTLGIKFYRDKQNEE